MPDGSSSEAPVINPGPSALSKARKLNGWRAPVFGVGFRPPDFVLFLSSFLRLAFLRFAMPRSSRRDNDPDRFRFRAANLPDGARRGKQTRRGAHEPHAALARRLV